MNNSNTGRGRNFRPQGAKPLSGKLLRFLARSDEVTGLTTSLDHVMPSDERQMVSSRDERRHHGGELLWPHADYAIPPDTPARMPADFGAGEGYYVFSADVRFPMTADFERIERRFLAHEFPHVVRGGVLGESDVLTMLGLPHGSQFTRVQLEHNPPSGQPFRTVNRVNNPDMNVWQRAAAQAGEAMHQFSDAIARVTHVTASELRGLTPAERMQRMALAYGAGPDALLRMNPVACPDANSWQRTLNYGMGPEIELGRFRGRTVTGRLSGPSPVLFHELPRLTQEADDLVNALRYGLNADIAALEEAARHADDPRRVPLADDGSGEHRFPVVYGHIPDHISIGDYVQATIDLGYDDHHTLTRTQFAAIILELETRHKLKQQAGDRPSPRFARTFGGIPVIERITREGKLVKEASEATPRNEINFNFRRRRK